jgi:hypothetical protein
VKYITLITLVSVLALTGCSFNAPGVHARIGDADAIRLDIDDDRGENFCPPGHRMKGKC